MGYKETLIMTQSGFEMRGNLNIKEPLIIDKWNKENVYEQMNLNRKDAKEFVLHDGPPYANGDMHCGHMLNRVLKDVIVRYKNMSGFYTPFVPGWDTHGLPIENMVTKSGVNRKTTPIDEFRDKCEQYALQQVEKQKAQQIRLGVLGDFAHPYLTLQKELEAEQIRNFAKMALKGYIYKGLKPVYWSPSSESALAEAEIEYKDVLSHSIYVRFKVIDGKGIIDNDAYLLIWTTTPWTIPANQAISVHPRFKYGLYQTNKGKLVFLIDFAERLKDELELGDISLLKEIEGKDMEYILCAHPFYDRHAMVLVADYVTADAGTGLVHNASGHGAEDFVICKKYGIETYCAVDEKGRLVESTGPRLAGLYFEDANKVVLDMLNEVGALVKHSTFTHSYPHDWRTGKPLIFRATKQWFCSIEPVRKRLLDEINNEISWYPSWGKNRMINMIKDRSDWCISRQRAWGVPIPIIYNEDDSPIIDKDVFEHIAKIFEQYGSNEWFKRSAIELLPEGYKNPASPHNNFKKEQDIMDVWFDSGSSFAGTLIKRGLAYPSDMYLEGSDQFRGWFNSSLIISTMVNNIAPYKTILSHGWVLDEHGEQMHKSKGNGIDPNKIAATYGADILRLWASTVDYQQDVRIGNNLIKQVSEQYRKIRNTLKFISWSLADFDPKNATDEFCYTDLLVLNANKKLINSVINNMDNYDFASAMNAIMTFMSTTLSSFYISIIKDTLYCDKKDSLRRRQVQTTLYIIGEALLRMLNPVLCFTMDEFNLNMPGERKNNAQYYDYPSKQDYDESLDKEFDLILKLRADVTKALEEARNNQIIRSEQEADVYAYIKNESLKSLINKFDKDELNRLFVVSRFSIVEDKLEKEYDMAYIDVIHHRGIFCDRCWNYEDDALEMEDGTHLCHRCYNIIKGNK